MDRNRHCAVWDWRRTVLQGDASALNSYDRKDGPVVLLSESDTAKVKTHHLSGNRTDGCQPRRSTLRERDHSDIHYRAIMTSVTWSRSSLSTSCCQYKDAVCGGRNCNGRQSCSLLTLTEVTGNLDWSHVKKLYGNNCTWFWQSWLLYTSAEQGLSFVVFCSLVTKSAWGNAGQKSLLKMYKFSTFGKDTKT